MSKYTPARHAHCHVCGHWTRLTERSSLLYRHRYGGATGADYCIGSRYRVGQIIPGFLGPYVRDPRHKDQPTRDWWKDDYFQGYRAHLRHPYTCLQGESGCGICGGHSDRKTHEPPYEKQHDPDPPTQEELDAQPRPVFTDTRWESRMGRIRDLKQPAVSCPPRGDSRKVVQRYPDTNTQEDPMNLNITAERGKQKAHRVYATTEDNLQGFYCESDDLEAAVGQVVSLVAKGNTTLREFVTETVIAATPKPLVATTQPAIKATVRRALSEGRYVKIDYDPKSLKDDPSYDRKVYPLYETADLDGFVARDPAKGPGPRHFKYARVTQVKVID